jgi:hypothetical protein
MKKKIRDITVNDKKYCWKIDNQDWESINFITIWYDKKIIYQEKIPYEKIYHITPKFISDIIKSL